MKNFSLFVLSLVGTVLICFAAAPVAAQTLFPADRATMVNPDVQLKLTFMEPPRVGTSGKIRIYDAADDHLVDTLDMSIPPGPTKPVDPAIRAKEYLKFPYPYDRSFRPTNANTKPGTPSAGAVSTSDQYQLTIIGGFTDGFHFYPITVNEKTATIHPHHDLLQHGK
ncbi:MAG: pectinesterase family protein, partial [Candidatus Binatia bacterium]